MRPVLGEHQLNTITPTDLDHDTATHGLYHPAAHRTLTHERAFTDEADLASNGHRIAVQPLPFPPHEHTHLGPRPSRETDVDGFLVADRAHRGVAGAQVEQSLEGNGGIP